MGGAIFNDAGSVTVTNSTFAGNSAMGGANALAASTNSDGYGGALFNYNGSMSLDFVTLSGNSATAGSGGSGGNAYGGAIYSLGDSLAACSAGGNTCSTSAASLTLNSTIAANNIGASDVATNAINGGGNSSAGVGNVIASNTGFAGTVVSTADPNLAALIPGGGLESVMIPAVGSPAIDAGSCDATSIDQRGDPRPWQQTPCDVGAVETTDVIFGNGFE